MRIHNYSLLTYTVNGKGRESERRSREEIRWSGLPWLHHPRCRTLKAGCEEGKGDEQTKGTRDVIQLHYSLAKLPFSLALFTNSGPRRAPHPSD